MANISKHRRIHSSASGIARSRRSPAERTTFGTAAAASSGFLKSRFLPIYQSSPYPRRFTGSQLRQYMASYRQLCEVYQLTECNADGAPDLTKITSTYWNAFQQLRVKYANIHLQILQSETDTILLSTLQHYPTGYNWHYIPVAPVYRMLNNKFTKSAGELLLSVFHYLYNHAKVPYYRQSDSYLYDTYEMMEQWITDDAGEMERVHYEEYVQQIQEAERIGDIILAKLRKKKPGTQLEKRIEQFTAQSDTDQTILFIARRCLYLLQQYPDSDIFQHIPLPSEEEEPDDEPDILSFHKYISFSADNKGTFNEQIEETLNCDFQEYANMEEPCIRRYLDGSPLNMKDHLDFENLLFPMITQLCMLLKDLS